jgi:protein TonB
MAFLQQKSWRDRPGAIAAVIAIHGLVGYALITGLKATGLVTHDGPLIGETIDVPITPPPPPPKPDTKVEPDTSLTQPKANAPIPPLDLGPQRPAIDATDIIIPQHDPIPKPLPSASQGPMTTPSPKFSPVGVRPRNDPGSWVTTSDYRSSWINREMVGTARFRLEVAADGKVQNCAIIGTSGYPELDAATCALVTRRARFDAAKDETGARTSGSYTSSVKWELPE